MKVIVQGFFSGCRQRISAYEDGNLKIKSSQLPEAK